MRISDWSSDVLLFRSVARGELLGGHALDVADEPGAVVGQRDRHRVYVEVDGVGPSLGATQQSQGVATHGGDRPDGDHAATTGRHVEELFVLLVAGQAGQHEVSPALADVELDPGREEGPPPAVADDDPTTGRLTGHDRSDEHPSELQSLMPNSYA